MTHTPTPWVYRPGRFDDWGYIRGPAESGERFGDIAAIARGGDEKFHDDHRTAGTDPYAANAAFIVKAVNSHEALVKALTEIRDFPYIGDAARVQMMLIAREALLLVSQAHEDAAK